MLKFASIVVKIPLICAESTFPPVYFIPRIPAIIKARRYPGRVVYSTLLILSKRFTSQTPAERFVVSETGDNLSPKSAPVIMQPAVMAGLIPRPAPIPISATPNVAAVPHDVPVARADIEQTIIVATKKIDGAII